MKLRFLLGILLSAALPLAAQTAKSEKGDKSDKKIVEEIVARVNNEIITLSELERSKATIRTEAAEECPSCSAAQINEQVKGKEKTALRDLVDQSLLVQRAKDMGLSVQTELIKQLDDLRQRNNLPDMDALCKAVEGQGMDCDEFKNNLKNRLLTQEVIRREVGGRMNIGQDEVKKYYDEHKKDFVRPDKVFLSELFVSTENKSPEEVAIQEKRAQVLLDRVKKGEDFSELAKRFSDGSTAQQGGELGEFERGKLSKEIEDKVFKMNKGETTDLIRTQTGFLILRVEMRYEAGQQPVEKVEGEIMNKLYYEKLQPSVRTYLAKLREESYVQVKPGYSDDTAASSMVIAEVVPVVAKDDDPGKKKKRKKFIIF